MGHMKWSDFKIKMLSPEERQAAAEEAARVIEGLQLKELRKKLGKTQAELSASLLKRQASLSKMEGQTDWMLSTLVKYLRALGANLRMFAEVDGAMFPLLFVEAGRSEPGPARTAARPRATSARAGKGKGVRAAPRS